MLNVTSDWPSYRGFYVLVTALGATAAFHEDAVCEPNIQSLHLSDQIANVIWHRPRQVRVIQSKLFQRMQIPKSAGNCASDTRVVHLDVLQVAQESQP